MKPQRVMGLSRKNRIQGEETIGSFLVTIYMSNDNYHNGREIL